MKITVFGGSHPVEGTEAYEEARLLGSLLGKNGHAVITGGYRGTMEAVSRGANEAGAHVIGVTCIDIENWRGSKANQWVKEEIRKQTLIDRLDTLIHTCDAAMALSGGSGTLTEIALMWNLMVIESLPRKPLILIGREWKNTIDSFYNELGVYMSNGQRELLYFADDVRDAVKFLENGDLVNSN